MNRINIRIFYPADPVGVVPGGIDTFIRGMIKWAPDDLRFSLVGMTTDATARPVGRWTRCHVGNAEFDFFPVVEVADSGSRGRLPLSLRYTLAVIEHLPTLRVDFDVFDFHRLEPSLLFARDSRPKNVYFHNDPQAVRSPKSDNLWRHLPFGYEFIERQAMPRFDTAWCVRQTGMNVLRERYPAQAEAIRFIPTWVDAEVFHPVGDDERRLLRLVAARSHGLDPEAQWIVTVGRLDAQKDPLLMLDAFERLRRAGRRVAWLVVGDGVLRRKLEFQVQCAGLVADVHFLGLRSPAAIADLLRASDVFALSSAYEGMPMALLEALGCGLPAAVTDVGEVARVVRPGVNGVIAAAGSEASFAEALAEVLDAAVRMRGRPSFDAVADYRPADVLAPAYEGYRRLGRESARVRNLRVDRAPAERRRFPVVGVWVDVAGQFEARYRLMRWAVQRESRYACFVNVHSAVHASYDELHRLALAGADLAAPDGAPIAWTLGLKASSPQERVNGPDLMWELCAEAERRGVDVGLYGAAPATLEALTARLRGAFPSLRLVYVHAPPFGPLGDAEDEAVRRAIAASGAQLLFVGLGCPKQEYWMARQRGKVEAVMVGVGAAFDFHAGVSRRAPRWMRDNGLEWLHRLCSQPRRLGSRYFLSNSLFVAKSAREAAARVVPRRKPKRTWPRTASSQL